MKTPVPETLEQVFSCEFYEILKNTCFIEHLRITVSGLSCTLQTLAIIKDRGLCNNS